MASRFAAGKRALAICDRCGLTYKLKTLKKETVNGVQINLKVCDSCWDLDHPQNFQGRYPVVDAEALRDPRPDTGEDASRTITVPGGGTVEDYIENNIP